MSIFNQIREKLEQFDRTPEVMDIKHLLTDLLNAQPLDSPITLLADMNESNWIKNRDKALDRLLVDKDQLSELRSVCAEYIKRADNVGSMGWTHYDTFKDKVQKI